MDRHEFNHFNTDGIPEHSFEKDNLKISTEHKARVGISGTTAKSRQRKFVPSSHPGPFAVVATSRKSQTKVGTLACFDLL